MNARAPMWVEGLGRETECMEGKKALDVMAHMVAKNWFKFIARHKGFIAQGT